MTALDLCAAWPVPTVAGAVMQGGSVVSTRGDVDAKFRLASLSKPMTAWAVLVAVEEGIVDLDAVIDKQFAGQPGCTLRHLLSHAGGYGFMGTDPIAAPERTRTYSNGGVELAAAWIESHAEMPFADYLSLAVFEPLGMTSAELIGSPAYGVWASVDDVVRFLAEARTPRLLASATADETIHVQFPALGGMVPGVGRYERCPWGLGFEIRGDKSPHWTGTRNDAATYGHFGGAGTMMWTDPAADVSLVALTDRPFDQWAADALRYWPALSDAVLDEFAVAGSAT
jgi:CubicO group peptidase (beta-lactamase class C family)